MRLSVLMLIIMTGHYLSAPPSRVERLEHFLDKKNHYVGISVYTGNVSVRERKTETKN